jgi:hypothetical protein
LMEKIMSTINDTSKLRNEDGEAFTLDHGDANTAVRQLRDDELQKVSGARSSNYSNFGVKNQTASLLL